MGSDSRLWAKEPESLHINSEISIKAYGPTRYLGNRIVKPDNGLNLAARVALRSSPDPPTAPKPARREHS
jgi:hypothetical protein